MKNSKIRINYNNLKPQIKQEQKIEQKDLNNLSENKIENELLNKNIQSENNIDSNNNNTLSLNSYRDKSSTERNDVKGSSKNKNSYKYKLSARDSLAQNNMQLREINLRFLLTKEEYAILMKEKAKHQNSLII